MAEFGFLGAIVMLILVVYFFLALGRIWYYSKQQFVLLKEIRNELKRPL